MVEPAASLTDLLLGLVALALALRLRGRTGPPRYWRLAFAWSAAAALGGAVHHGFVDLDSAWREPSWAVISLMVVVAVSYVLAATVAEVLGPGRAREFWLLRSAGFVAYAVAAALGHPGVVTMLACEGVTMVAVLVLWGMAVRRGHPRAWPVIAAIAASIGAGAVRGVVGDAQLALTFDGNAVYHLAQVPGLILLYVAVRRRDAPPADDPRPQAVPQHA
jgi:hypothetical protein